MEHCILCSSKIKNRQIDEGLFFNKELHYECNVNIIVTDGAPESIIDGLKERINNAVMP